MSANSTVTTLRASALVLTAIDSRPARTALTRHRRVAESWHILPPAARDGPDDGRRVVHDRRSGQAPATARRRRDPWAGRPAAGAPGGHRRAHAPRDGGDHRREEAARRGRPRDGYRP